MNENEDAADVGVAEACEVLVGWLSSFDRVPARLCDASDALLRDDTYDSRFFMIRSMLADSTHDSSFVRVEPTLATVELLRALFTFYSDNVINGCPFHAHEKDPFLSSG